MEASRFVANIARVHSLLPYSSRRVPVALAYGQRLQIRYPEIGSELFRQQGHWRPYRGKMRTQRARLEGSSENLAGWGHKQRGVQVGVTLTCRKWQRNQSTTAPSTLAPIRNHKPLARLCGAPGRFFYRKPGRDQRRQPLNQALSLLALARKRRREENNRTAPKKGTNTEPAFASPNRHTREFKSVI